MSGFMTTQTAQKSVFGRKMAGATIACKLTYAAAIAQATPLNVARCTSKLRATNCQNRYPSPTRRPDLSRIRSLCVWQASAHKDRGQISLTCGRCAVMTDSHHQTRYFTGAILCGPPSNLRPSLPLRPLCRPAVKPTASVPQPVHSLVARPRPSLAKTSSTVRLLVVLPARSAVRQSATANPLPLCGVNDLSKPVLALCRGGFFACKRAL